MAEGRKSHVMKSAAAIAAFALIASACTKTEPALRPPIRGGSAIDMDAAAGRLYVLVSVSAPREGSGTKSALVIVDLPGRRPIGFVEVGDRFASDVGMTVDPSRHVVFVLEGSGISAIDGRTGRLNSRAPLQGETFQTIQVNPRTASLVVEFQSEDGLAVIDAKTFARRGKIANDYGLFGAAVDTVRQRLYLISDSGTIAVCDLRNNAIVRTVPVQSSSPHGMAVDEQTGILYVVGGEDPFLQAVDPERGTVAWSLALEDLGTHQVAIGPRGMVFVVGPHGALTVVDSRRRAIIGSFVIKQEMVDVVADPRTQTAYVLDARGTVHIIDGRTLKETGTIDVAAAVPEPVYDEQRDEFVFPERLP